MKARMTVSFLATLLLATSPAAGGQTTVYRPLGTSADPTVAQFARWEAARQARIAEAIRAVKPASRPQLAGLRPRSVELLQDALLRKHPKLLKNSATRAQLIMRLKPDRLHWLLAEAIVVERGYGYVSKPNAPQHDVYRWLAGRSTPQNGQVKFHRTLRPSVYAADMRKDYRAEHFLIPDDHVEPMKAYFARKAVDATAAGDQLEAKRLWWHRTRLQPIGATTGEILAMTDEAKNSLGRERYATYAAFGAAMALSLGPAAWDWANGNVPGNVALYRTTRALSILGVGVGTDGLLILVREGSLRGTVRGNVIVGTAISIAEVTWLLYEHGWSQSFRQPEFYEQVFGGVSGVGVGLVGGAAAVPIFGAIPYVGPFLVIGTGITTGTIGYLGGRVATRSIIDIINPEMFQQQERQRISTVQVGLERAVAQLRAWPQGK